MFGIDLVSLLFLLFLVVLSGFIAYAGDLIGRSFGKRRLTLMGLRPRHTAAVMTGLFGALATLVAVGSLIAVSEPVRAWIVEGNKAREQLVSAREELKGSRERLDKTQGELALEAKKLAAASKRVEDAGKQIVALQATAKGLRTTITQIRSNLARSKSELGRIQSRYRLLLQEADSIARNNKEVVRQNKQFASRNLELEMEVGRNERRLEAQRQEIAQLTSSISELGKTIEGLQAKLAEEGSRAAKELAALRAEIESLERDRERAERERIDASEKLAEAQSLLQSVLRRLEGSTTASRLQPMVYQNGDELARLELRAGLSAAESRSLFLAILDAADSQARSYGAGTMADGVHAGLVLRYGPDNEPIPVELQRARTIERMSGSRNEQVLLARAFLNAFRGEPVALDLAVLPNPVVFRAGEVVAETRVDGRETEAQIVKAVESFAQGGLSKAAVERGMIPAVGKPEPLGEIPSDQLIEVVRTARQASRPLRLQFVAAQETKAAQRLKLELRLR